MSAKSEGTIFALSSAPGRAGVAVVRVSGRGAGAALDLMAGPRPKPRVAAGRAIRHPRSGEVLDRGVVLWFPAPKSFTGEDVAEFQVHGGRAVVAAVLGALAAIPDFRAAEAGEFARRAFENGKIDLAEVEGLSDLIDAETEAQRRQALLQASGKLSALYESWRGSLTEAIALVEASLDFSDEADVSTKTMSQARAVIEVLARAVNHHLDDGHRGEIVRDGFRVALLGAPNVGKSSLLNALARREAAIVSAEAGTTRDVIEVRLDLGGYAVIVSDTAGLRKASGEVEQEGIRRSLETARAADLIIWLTDAAQPETILPAELRDVADRTLLVLNKIDTLSPGSLVPDDMVAISARTGAGIAELTKRLSVIAAERVGSEAVPLITQERHRQLLSRCAEGLAAFLREPAEQAELRAEDLRRAADALGRITGRVDVEDILDHIFGRFCIGK